MQYINGQLLQVIEYLLRAEPRPIMVLQGDHGPPLELLAGGPSIEAYRERHGVLNAYLVPERIEAKLYLAITPVTRFRVILSALFGDEHPLPEDRSYFSWYAESELAIEGRPTQRLTEVTDVLP